ncbi:MAG: RNA 3'-terminal phosphate cyclase [Alphaproteobacteria bacterium]
MVLRTQIEPLEIDGSHGEGGGQILRTAVSLAAITSRAVHFKNIRAGRRVPGLAAQHVTSVRAAAALCAADLEGDLLGSQQLTFAPRRPVQAGAYHFDVAAARPGGSAGATSLVMQTVLVPLALAHGPSEIIVDGGTHNPMSPPFDYLRDVWLRSLGGMGVAAKLELEAWGWYPAGQGRIRAKLQGRPRSQTRLSAFELETRGALVKLYGRAVAANLPSHIAERMATRASVLLQHLGCPIDIGAICVEAKSAGAGLFLCAEYEHCAAGFSAIGRRGRPSEEVAEEAAFGAIAFNASSAALDSHLGDQLLLPAAFADRPSRCTVHRVTRHLRTNAWVIEQFGIARVEMTEHSDGVGGVLITPLT